MELIKHRINSLEELVSLDEGLGAEIDIRYHCNELILHHDPFGHHKQEFISLDKFLRNWKNFKNILILNVKTEGIEEACIELINKYKISNWFFLDLSMPYFVKYANFSNAPGFSSKNLAVRFSDLEPIEYSLSFKDKAKWVWIDTFKEFPLNMESYERLKNANLKIILVSPELQKHDISMIEQIRIITQKMNIDAVCTKFPELWK